MIGNSEPTLCGVTTLLIDTDPGADDAVAIAMALRSPGVEVAALTTVAGNAGLYAATRNALIVLEAAGRGDIHVHPGASRPLEAEPATAGHIHGEDGLGDQGFAAAGAPHDTPAADATVALLRERGPEITWVALGPLTNVARAVLMDPEACRSVRALVVMGGVGDGVGNVTPSAEFNFWADPEAARLVLGSRMPLKLVGWDVARRDALVSGDDLEVLRTSGGDLATFILGATSTLFDFTSRREPLGTMDLPDPLAMAAALEPESAEWIDVHADVECRGELTRGALVIDHLGSTGREANVALCTGFDPGRFRELFLRTLTSEGKAATP